MKVCVCVSIYRKISSRFGINKTLLCCSISCVLSLTFTHAKDQPICVPDPHSKYIYVSILLCSFSSVSTVHFVFRCECNTTPASEITVLFSVLSCFFSSLTHIMNLTTTSSVPWIGNSYPLLLVLLLYSFFFFSLSPKHTHTLLLTLAFECTVAECAHANNIHSFRERVFFFVSFTESFLSVWFFLLWACNQVPCAAVWAWQQKCC